MAETPKTDPLSSSEAGTPSREAIALEKVESFLNGLAQMTDAPTRVRSGAAHVLAEVQEALRALYPSPPAPAGLDSREGMKEAIEHAVCVGFHADKPIKTITDAILALLSQPPAAEEHEDNPCGLCDTAGRCTFACENAESVPAPTPEQLSTRYWSMLVLSAKVLDDLTDPEAEPKKITRIRESCARLRDEIREVIASPAHPEVAEMPGRDPL